jgi:hypothetical protein
LGGDYRDDDSVFTTAGVRARGYYRTERLSTGVRLGRSRIEANYHLGPVLSRYLDDTQNDYRNEYGLDVRYSFGAFAIYANGTDYEYDAPFISLAPRRNDTPVPSDRFPRLQQELAQARARLSHVSFATLRLATNLLDYSVALGGDYTFGEQVVNIELSRERVALDEVEIDSVAVGWSIPIGKAADLEMRVGGAKVQDADTLFYGSLNFTFYR